MIRISQFLFVHTIQAEFETLELDHCDHRDTSIEMIHSKYYT